MEIISKISEKLISQKWPNIDYARARQKSKYFTDWKLFLKFPKNLFIKNGQILTLQDTRQKSKYFPGRILFLKFRKIYLSKMAKY